jgi:hypothetical protein
MATLVITASGPRISKLGAALQCAALEAPSDALNVACTVDNTAMSVTLPSGKVITV